MKTNKGYSYSYNYADLADVLDAVRPVLAKHGLAVAQTVMLESSLNSWLLHTSGQWIRSEYGVVLGEDVPDTPQARGSALTYARRYALCALLGIAAEEDDDGTASTAPGETRRTRRPAPKAPPKLADAIKRVAALPALPALATAAAWARETYAGDDLAAILSSVTNVTHAVIADRLGQAKDIETLNTLAGELGATPDLLTPDQMTAANEAIDKARVALTEGAQT